MRIDKKFLCRTLVEIRIAFRGIIERDHCSVDGLRNLNAIVQDRHHQATVVLQDRSLAGTKGVRLRPREAKPQAEIAGSGRFVFRTRVLRHVEARNANGACGARCSHQLIEYHSRLLGAAMSLGFETYAINRTIHFWHTEYPCEVLADRTSLGKVNCFASERSRLSQALLIEIRHD